RGSACGLLLRVRPRDAAACAGGAARSHRLLHPAVRFRAGHAAGARLHRRCRGARDRDPHGRNPHHLRASRGRPRRAEAGHRRRELSTIVPSLAARDEAHPVIRWLMTEARRRTDPNEFLEAFAHELRAAGVDVARITTGVPILHPQIFSFSGLWELGKGTTERLFRSGPNTTATMLNSPIRIAYQGGGPVRCDLALPPEPGEFAILGDLRHEGFTDYIVHAVPFADGSHKALSLATRRSGGFDAGEVALFAAMIPAVAFNLEVQALRRTARTLLDTYVGQQSGGRVLEGQIQRGSGETIRAVIWLCDLRGFTNLSEQLPRDELIDLLNCYFGPMCDAVAGEGGEILKFIGDAMLAIFPTGNDAARTCAAALSA